MGISWLITEPFVIVVLASLPSMCRCGFLEKCFDRMDELGLKHRAKLELALFEPRPSRCARSDLHLALPLAVLRCFLADEHAIACRSPVAAERLTMG